MRLVIIGTSILAVLLCESAAMAQRCAGATGDPNAIVMCEDFDRYCDPPPADPTQACNCRTQDPDMTYPPGTDTNSFYYTWPPITCAGSGPYARSIDTLYAWRASGDTESWKCHKDADAIQGYGLRVYQQDSTGVAVYHHERDITALIQNNPRNTVHQYARINGGGSISVPVNPDSTIPPDYVDSFNSLLRPDALKGRFLLYLPGGGAHSNMVFYVELYLDEDRAPFNWTTVYCPAAGTRGTISQPRLSVSDGQVHASFALGLIATMDRNPCDLDTGWKPTSWHLAVYDGLYWNIFDYHWSSTGSPPNFGIPSVTPEHGADLQPKDGWNTVSFAIGADAIEVRLSNSWSSQNYAGNGGPNPNPYCVARVPREYKGPFNKVAIGPNKGLDIGTPTCDDYGPVGAPNLRCTGGSAGMPLWNGASSPNPTYQKACTTAADCPASVSTVCPLTEAGNDLYMDELALWDGVFQDTVPGSCCQQNGECIVTTQEACTAASGTWGGLGTDCSQVTCCPHGQYVWADHDADGDVDLVDFSAFQICYTGSAGGVPAGCECFNRDAVPDNDIDGDDFVAFTNCVSGPSVPWTAGSTPFCVP